MLEALADRFRGRGDGRAAAAGQETLEGEVLGPEIREEVDPAEERRVRRDFWATMRRAIRQVPFAEDVVAAYYCALDPAVPMRVRATLLAALGYFVLPIDGIPDVIVGIGFGDDVSVLAGAIGMVVAHITEDHRAAARDALADAVPEAAPGAAQRA